MTKKPRNLFSIHKKKWWQSLLWDHEHDKWISHMLINVPSAHINPASAVHVCNYPASIPKC